MSSLVGALAGLGRSGAVTMRVGSSTSIAGQVSVGGAVVLVPIWITARPSTAGRGVLLLMQDGMAVAAALDESGAL